MNPLTKNPTKSEASKSSHPDRSENARRSNTFLIDLSFLNSGTLLPSVQAPTRPKLHGDHRPFTPLSIVNSEIKAQLTVF